MNKITRVGHSEVIALTLVYLGAKVFIGLPRSYIEIGGTAGWTLPIFSGFLALLLWLLVVKLLARFPGKNLAEIYLEVYGPLLGTACNLIFIFYFSLTTGNLLRQFGDSVILTALPQAPISSITFLFIVPITLAVYLGIEPVIRAVFISFPFIIFGTVGILLALIPFWDFTQVYPLFGNGLTQLAIYSLPMTSTFAEVMILAIMVSFFSFESKKLAQVGAISIIVIALFFSLSTLVYEMVISYPGSLESLSPYYQLARSIYLGRFFQRVEAVFTLFWTYCAFLRLSLGLFVGIYFFKETFKIPYLHPLIPAMAILYLSVALTPTDLMQTIAIEKYRSLIGSLFSFGIPLFTLAVALMRGKGVKHEEARE